MLRVSLHSQGTLTKMGVSLEGAWLRRVSMVVSSAEHPPLLEKEFFLNEKIKI